MVGTRYGIRWLPNYEMGAEPFSEGGLRSPDSPILDLVPEERVLEPGENPFPFPYVRQFDTMMIEPNIYLPAMLQDFEIAGGRIEVREIRDLADLQTLPEQVIVNCTGLGAKALFNDDELTPVKGQLTFLLPQPEVNTSPCRPTCTCFLAATESLARDASGSGVWSLDPTCSEATHLAGHAAIFQT